MSSLDDLKYMLARAGHSPEQVQQVEQDVIQMAALSWKSPEQMAQDVAAVFSAYGEFKQSMQSITKNVGETTAMLNDIAVAIRSLAEVPDIETPPTKPTEKTPYYHKSKQTWWKEGKIHERL